MNRLILIADNDELVRKGLKDLLSAAGYTTFFAVDGVSLFDQARSHQPDLIMLDLCLPAGNAVTLVGALRRLNGFMHIPIVIVASRDHRSCTSEILDAGANAFLPRPFNRQIIFSVLAKLLPAEKIRAAPWFAPLMGSGQLTEERRAREFGNALA